MKIPTNYQEKLIAQFKLSFSGSTDYLSGINDATYALLATISECPCGWGFEILENTNLENKHVCTFCKLNEYVTLKDRKQYCEKCDVFV